MFLIGIPGDILLRGRPGDKATAALSLEAVLPFVAARLLLLLPPPGGGPVSGPESKARHFLTRLLALFASNLSEDFLLNSLICFPNLVA